jgi:hypothetical protein
VRLTNKQTFATIKEPLRNNWFGLPDYTTTNQPVENNQNNEVV